MSTRGILAVERDGAWRGFEISSDAYPTWAGDELLKALKANGFDGTCTKVEQAKLFDGMRGRATPASHRDRGDLEWLYFLRPATKTLHVFSGGAYGASLKLPNLYGTWTEMAVLAVGSDGRCTPPEIKVEFPVPWPLFPVVEGWAEATQEQAWVRLDTRKRIERDCAAAGIAVAGFLDLVSHAVTEAIFQAPWKGTRSDGPMTRVYVPFAWHEGVVNWRVRLGTLELLYPPPQHRRSVVQTDATGSELLGVWAPGGAEAQVPVRRSEVTRALGPNAKKAYDILMSAVPSGDWVLSFFDQVRATQIEDSAADAAGVAVSLEVAREQGVLPWKVFHHPDGRVWAIRAAKTGYQLRLGDPADDPVIKERPSRTTDNEILKLISEQVADGFVQQPDAPA